MLPANRSAATADFIKPQMRSAGFTGVAPRTWATTGLVRVGGRPASAGRRKARMGRSIVQRQIHLSCRIGFREPLEKGDKMDGQLALLIGKEPVPEDAHP